MNLAPLIDHTCLAPGAVAADIDILCDQAMAHGFHSVCVAPVWVARAAKRVEESGVRVCSVVGFPHGAHTRIVKGVEAEGALTAGALELDMVMSIGAFLDGDREAVLTDIALVADFARQVRGAVLKVILETALLNSDQVAEACRIAEHGGAHFVKTSTGFGSGGATVDAVRVMRQTVGTRLGVKASGGIRDRATAEAMIRAGATRLGCSASLAIVSVD